MPWRVTCSQQDGLYDGHKHACKDPHGRLSVHGINQSIFDNDTDRQNNGQENASSQRQLHRATDQWAVKAPTNTVRTPKS